MPRSHRVDRDDRSDAELTAAYRGGEGAAAAELYRRYYLKTLYGVITGLPSIEIAEDCVGEAFLRVLEIIRRGEGPTSNFYGYLRSAVASERARYFRDRKLGPSLDSVAESGGRELSTNDDLSYIELSLLVPALHALPERWRTLLTLRYIEMLKPSQMAVMLNEEASALHKTLYRAKRGLRDEYLKQVALSRSSLGCRGYTDELVAFAASGSRSQGDSGLEVHLHACSDCQATLLELEHQSRRASPAVLGLGIILGGLGAGSLLALGGDAGKANALDLPRSSAAERVGKRKTVETVPDSRRAGAVAARFTAFVGILQTLGATRAVRVTVLGATLAVGLVGVGAIHVTKASSPSRVDAGPAAADEVFSVADKSATAVAKAPTGVEKRTQTTMRTDDGNCELSITVQEGTLIVDAAAHKGKCWFIYNRVGDEPREEQSVSAGWMVVTRVAGEYEFVLRSPSGSTTKTITL